MYVIDEIVERNLCIGCGACTLVCPLKKLQMQLGNRGHYEVIENDRRCIEKCGKCLGVCPFFDGNENEDDIGGEFFPRLKWDKWVGFHLNSYSGHLLDDAQRVKGSSGGLTRWLLAELLENHFVDYVVCVEQGVSESLFAYTLYSSPEEVLHSCKSAYYPVHLCLVLEAMRRKPGRFAIVALPCFCKAIRLLCKRDDLLKGRIACLVGLVCGHGATSYFTEYISERLGEEPESLVRVSFRFKEKGRSGYDFGIRCIFDKDGQSLEKTLYWVEAGIPEMWSNHTFTPVPCFYCDDVFAETADIALMDAWLPEYICDYRGRNLVVTRSRDLDAILRQGRERGNIVLENINLDRVKESQEQICQFKRDDLQHRLWLQQKKGIRIRKRVSSRKEARPLRRILIEEKLRIAKESPRVWSNRKGITHFEGVVEKMARRGRFIISLRSRVDRILAGTRRKV